MDRRAFFKRLGLLTAIAASPKTAVELLRAYATSPKRIVEPLYYDWKRLSASVVMTGRRGGKTLAMALDEKINESREQILLDLHRYCFQKTPFWEKLKRRR